MRHPRRHLWLRTLAILIIALSGAAASWKLAKSRTFQTAGDLIARIETDQRKVALTFDDGPTPQAIEALLPILAERNIKATFFVTGAEVRRRPALAKQLIAAGHELGNHSYSHQRMIFKSRAFISEEVERTDALLRQAGATGDILFRPPYGAKGWTLPHYLADTKRRTIMWDVEPDSRSEDTRSSEAITQTTLANTQPGSIILLHVMYPSRQTSLAAVPAIIDGLTQRGYTFVTVSELLALAANPNTTAQTPQ